MKRKRSTIKTILTVPRQAAGSTPVVEVGRRSGISEQTYDRWQKQYGKLGVDQISQIRQLENNRLKRLVADLMLDRNMLQEVLARVLEARQRRSGHQAKQSAQRGRVRMSAVDTSTSAESREGRLIQ